MMSLFTSFDLFMFWKGWISFFLVLFFLLPKLNYISSSNNFSSLIMNSLSSFFYSLKSKSFNKLSESIFVTFFLMLVFLNFFSVFSYNFPITSQVSVILGFSLGSWLSLNLFSIMFYPQKFFYHFIPEGTPLPLTFILFLIELTSTLIRPITLMVRLVANILAGHLLLILLSNLVFNFEYSFIFYVGLNLVEIFVSFIQSYIFATMMILYYSEV